jgi:exopolysaccharide biosynthesis polyprenyl glycosylphosphotransferase
MQNSSDWTPVRSSAQDKHPANDILSSEVFSRHNRKVGILFALSDVLLTALAFEAAYQTRQRLHLENVFFLSIPIKALLLGFALMVWVTLGYWFGIYSKLDSAHPRTILRGTFQQCAIGTVAVVLFEYALLLNLSRPFIALFAVYTWILLCLFRLKAGSLVGLIRREFGALHYVMVVGVGENALRLAQSLEESAGYGVRLIGFLSDRSDAIAEIALKQTYPVKPLSTLPELLRRHIVDEIIFALDGRRLAGLEEVFLLCEEEGVRTRVLVDFFPHVNSQVYLDRLADAPLLTFSATPHDEILLLLKRSIDFLLAGAALALLSPLMLVVAVVVRISSPGPAIFRQIRCGLNGRRFVVYKFRSMCADAEMLRASVAHLNRKDGAVFKIPDDPRLTAFGRFLRKFSIDEWPQLWNVIKGDMSLVGPRPAIPEEVEQYKRWQRRRLRMRPGLTCLWALAGRDRLDFETWMKLDMQYIDNWSLSLDWKIILRTIPRVLTGKGAY